MVRSVERYPSETIVVVHAKLRKAPKRIKNATIHDYELEVYEVHKVVNIQENTPFSVYDAENINRDKEDADEGDDASEESSPITPRSQDSESVNPQDLLRRSTDLSRLSGDMLSRSELARSPPSFSVANIRQAVWILTGNLDHCPKECDSTIEFSTFELPLPKQSSVFSLESATCSVHTLIRKVSSKSIPLSFRAEQQNQVPVFLRSTTLAAKHSLPSPPNSRNKCV